MYNFLRLINFKSVLLSNKTQKCFSKCSFSAFEKRLNLNSLERVIVRNTFTKTGNSSDLIVGKWLIGVSGMVSIAVVLGGVTRLTESGLSMVTWKLLGETRPKTPSEWQLEFEKYQEFPEFQMKNRNMTLDEFKFIYTMEYIHRMWGRAIGLVFFLPASIFYLRGYFCKATKIRVGVMGALLAAQGIMGWYMVKSGLEDRFQDVNDVPRVSQYRLASHLALAFVLYALSLSTGLKILVPAESVQILTKQAVRFRYMAHFCKGMIFLTAISGAFVAGLDAGLVYNSFPKMGDNWAPDDILAFKPAIKNFTENPSTVQFDHRILGISTLALSSILWMLSRRISLPQRSYWAANAVAAMAWLQATLGVTTLINHVPVSLATAHQSGSLILLSLVMWLTHELRLIKYIPK